jgi:heparanase
MGQGRFFFALSACALVVSYAADANAEAVGLLHPATMPLIGTVDERYQSYNIEMVEVMGGKWWAPYRPASATPAVAADATTPSGAIDTGAFMYRPPLDLTNARLRKLAAALSPAYVRVSDTWANTVYFQDTDAVAAGPAPAGFKAVLTGPQWKGVVDFSNAIDAQIVTSFSIGAGVRDTDGVWTPVEAAKLLAYTKRAGGRIAAAEFFNEPNLAAFGGAPKGYDAAAYGRDFKVFRAFVDGADPQMKILGPGAVGEGRIPATLGAGLTSAALLQAGGTWLDAVSWHFYGAVSQRCLAMGPALQTTPEAALGSAWLSATDAAAAFYGGLRDRYEPGKSLWLSETAESACGGNRWAAGFIDSFRYLNQLGILAKRGVQVVMHNTLSASDYGLIDEATLVPRPNYWAAVLWRRLMGIRVLEAGVPATPDLYVYAHCLRNQPGGVAVLAINADRTGARVLALPVAASLYALTAGQLLGTEVRLNGTTLALQADGDLPPMTGLAAPAGTLSLAPQSIAFLSMPAAHNRACY